MANNAVNIKQIISVWTSAAYAVDSVDSVD